MTWLSSTMRELVGLFVDDGSLALSLVGWVTAAALALPHVPLSPRWDAPILFAGCILILVENVGRTARRK